MLAHVDYQAAPPALALRGPLLLYATTVFVSLGVFLFGYDQGVYSGIITDVSFNQYFHHPSPVQIGAVVLVLELGAMVSLLLVGVFADRLGRKRTILVGAAVFVLGGSIQTFSLALLLVMGTGRVVSGLGVGILSSIVPLYQLEISPSHARGRFACIEFTGNICGYAASVWVDYFCEITPHQSNLLWRVPLFLQCALGAVLLAGGFIIVELPRWLLDVGRDQEGFGVLQLLYAHRPDGQTPESEFRGIKTAVEHEHAVAPPHTRTWSLLLGKYRWRAFLGCVALALAQMNGINIISYYAPMVFEQAGFKGHSALLVAGINALIYLALTIPPWFLVDRWGRRPIFISGAAVMGLCMALIAWFVYRNVPSTPALVAVLVIVYNAAFGYSWGPIGWLYPAEIFPLSCRAKGMSLATAANWLCNFAVGQLTPVLQDSIGWRMYLIPALFCAGSIGVVHRWFPETKGVELEQVDALFGEESYQQLGESHTHLFELDEMEEGDAQAESPHRHTL